MADVLKVTGIDQVRELVQRAKREKQPLYPQGGGTVLSLLGKPPVPGIAFSMLGMNQLLEHAANDMTITVQAGMTMAALQQQLATARQWLPIDVPYPDKATVGGSVSANVTGLRRAGYGTWRDYVIGLSFVNDRGELIRAGGKVVKNVAGYDFCKLLTGAHGTLGILTELTFKVRPLPEETVLLLVLVPFAKFRDIQQLLQKTACRPVVAAAQWQADRPDSFTLILGLEESAANVRWQREKLLTDLKTIGIDTVREEAGGEAKRTLAQHDQFQELESGPMFELTTQRSKMTEVVTKLRTVSSHLLIDLATGYIQGHMASAENLTALPPGTKVLRTPGSYLRQNEILAETTMMKKIKQALDPEGLFNPHLYFL